MEGGDFGEGSLKESGGDSGGTGFEQEEDGLLEQVVDSAGIAVAGFVDEGDGSRLEGWSGEGDFFKASLEVGFDLGFSEAFELELVGEPG